MDLGGIALQLVNNCIYESWDGSLLVLKLDPQHQHLQVDRPKQRLCNALEAALGQKIELKILHGSADAVTPARSQAIAAADKQRQAEKIMAEDPLVSALEERMGARLIAESIRPVDE